MIYGIHHQFAAVVNEKNIPEVIFIRAILPEEGIDLMKENFGKEVKRDKDLTKSPGNLCKALNITTELYGEDLKGDVIWLEDRGIMIEPNDIQTDSRVGISDKLRGSKREYRYSIKGV